MAVAYVTGRYTPPGPRPGPCGFLGLYLSGDEHSERFSFWTFTTRGNRLAYSAVSPKDANLEFALIWGALHYAVPFEQWRPYPVGAAERRILRKLGLRNDYEQARRALGRVLYQARIHAYSEPAKLAESLGLDAGQTLEPMFRLRPRSAAAIRRDGAEQEEVMKSVGLQR